MYWEICYPFFSLRKETNFIYFKDFILHVIHVLVGSIRRILLFSIALNYDQELAIIQKNFLSTEDQMRRGKEWEFFPKTYLFVLTQDWEFKTWWPKINLGT